MERGIGWRNWTRKTSLSDCTSLPSGDLENEIQKDPAAPLAADISSFLPTLEARRTSLVTGGWEKRLLSYPEIECNAS